MLVAYVDAHVMEEKDNACQTIAQIAQSTGYLIFITSYYIFLISYLIWLCNLIYLYLK